MVGLVRVDAEAEVASARLNLQFTQVRAPIAGRIGRALATEGNLAQAALPELAAGLRL